MLKTYSIYLMIAAIAAGANCLPDASVAAVENCMLKNSISQKELDETLPLLKNSIDLQIERKFKCFFKCLMKGLNIWKADGTFDVAELVKEIETPERKETIAQHTNDCIKSLQNVKNECEHAFKLYTCILREINY